MSSRITAYYRRYKNIINPILPKIPTMPMIKKPSYGPKLNPSAMTKKINRKFSKPNDCELSQVQEDQDPKLRATPTMPKIRKTEGRTDTIEGKDDNKLKTCFCSAMRARKSKCFYMVNERTHRCCSLSCRPTYQYPSKSASRGRRCVQRMISMRVVKDNANAGHCRKVAVVQNST